MNHSRVMHIPVRKLAIVCLILFAAGSFAILITLAWSLIQFPFELSPSQADPQEVVDDWHIAINSNNVDQVLALFASSATITDGKTVISGMDQIRNWVLHSKRMTGLQLNMFHSGLDGENLIWFDTAHNGWEGHSRYYILRWEAVIVKGKIQSLIVRSRYMPGFK